MGRRRAVLHVFKIVLYCLDFSLVNLLVKLESLGISVSKRLFEG